MSVHPAQKEPPPCLERQILDDRRLRLQLVMSHAQYTANFSGSHNHGIQAGYIAGNVGTHHYYPAERPETPPSPLLSIPFFRDPDFVDRGTIVNQIHERCAIPGSRTALVGFGGVGKSQLAIEYAYQTHEQSSRTWIFWVHASNVARFEQSYREIADTVKLFGRRDPKANIFKLVHDWLWDSKNGKWILILDNVDDAHFLINCPDDVEGQAGHDKNSSAGRPLRGYLPQSSNGTLLITSRSREAALKLVDQRDIIVIKPMVEADAQALFKKKLGEQGNIEDIAELSAALEFIPLAIVQAAAYISDPDRGCSVRQYLDEFQKSDRKKIRLLDHEEGQFRRDWEAKNTVLITWEISFDSIRQRRRSAADLLSIMSFFDRQGIPDTVLLDHRQQGAAELNEDNDADDSESQSSVIDDFKDDILMLQRYYFISVNADRTTFNMHSLVQLATRRWLDVNGELEKWKRQYIRNLNATFPTGEYENWAKCQALYPHAKSAVGQRPHEQTVEFEWALVLYKAAWYDWRKGNGPEGRVLSVKAMEALNKLLGLEHPYTLASIQMMGSIYLLEGQWKKAEELFVQVMETSMRVLDADHLLTLTSMANLASTYLNQGRWAQAEELFVQVMETRKRVQGAEHPDTLTSIANLASTYNNQGKWKEAQKLFIQLIEATKKMLGEKHPYTLASMGNLAVTYGYQGQWKEAEDLFMQVIETSKRVLGAKHPHTLASTANLASIYGKQGRWKEAEEIFLQVMEESNRVLGTEHPHRLISIRNLASMYRNQGRWNEAEELEVQVMEASNMLLGLGHPDTLISMSNLALTYRKRGRWEEARKLFVQVMKARKRVLGVEHPETLRTMTNLASTYINQRKWKEAEELLVQVTGATERMLGAEHPDTLFGIANLAWTYMNQGRHIKAEKLFMQVMEARKRVLGMEHPSTLTSMNNLASMYLNQGRWKEAEKLFLQVIETGKRVLCAEHPDILASMANLASTYGGQGQWKEAEELELRVMETSKRVLGVDHPSTLTSMANLASTYMNQRQWKEAKELEIQVMEMRKRVLGIEHPDTLASMNNLASTYWNQGRWKEAEELDVQVIETRKRVLGAEHPDTLSSMANLARTWKRQGRVVDAVNLMKDCVRLQKKILGAKHPNTLSSCTTLTKWSMQKLDISVSVADNTI